MQESRNKCSSAYVTGTFGDNIITINKGKTFNLDLCKNISMTIKIIYDIIKIKKKKYNLKIFSSGSGHVSKLKAIRTALVKFFYVSSNINKNILKNRNISSKSNFAIKERRKYGLKKARKAPQYTKR